MAPNPLHNNISQYAKWQKSKKLTSIDDGLWELLTEAVKVYKSPIEVKYSSI